MRVIVAVLLASLCASVALAGEGVGLGPGLQQWDFLELRPGAHMFYWLYNTLANVAAPEDRPVVVWLQGGPGASSTGYGNFEELGVLDLNLNYRNSTWVNEVNVVFVDNPVGTGYSYVEKTSLIPRSNAEVAADLVTFTKLFLERNPHFVKTPFFIFSESYGGKMAAEYALELQKAVERGDFEVNFQGVALGDGWVSPIDSVLTWAPFLLQTVSSLVGQLEWI
ncbi:Vitellogenic carboxypeptidase [Gryllus bimaculatus]|nr:Vitellogenic carboxypeptidase [Gryllus bimaculatus]